ncbi:unnamed protein product [Schistosoma turkestanicum]|nr:unnamed protein product [Schistosoma turkestanicum]
MSNGSESPKKNTPQNIIDTPINVAENRPTQTAVCESSRGSPKFQPASQNRPLSTKELSTSFMNGLPVQNQSSPILECVSRLPSYRRRSIHPDRPGIDNPYADDLTWFPQLSPNKKSCVQSPNKKLKTCQNNTKGILRDNLVKSFLYITIGLISIIFDCCFSFFFKLANIIFACLPSFRTCFCMAVFGLLLFGLHKILLGDPFYHNPVEDLYNIIRFPFVEKQ